VASKTPSSPLSCPDTRRKEDPRGWKSRERGKKFIASAMGKVFKHDVQGSREFKGKRERGLQEEEKLENKEEGENRAFSQSQGGKNSCVSNGGITGKGAS